MTMTDDPRSAGPVGGELSPARQTVNDMISAGLLDDLMGRVDAGDVPLTGDGGVLPENFAPSVAWTQIPRTCIGAAAAAVLRSPSG